MPAGEILSVEDHGSIWRMIHKRDDNGPGSNHLDHLPFTHFSGSRLWPQRLRGLRLRCWPPVRLTPALRLQTPRCGRVPGKNGGAG